MNWWFFGLVVGVLAGGWIALELYRAPFEPFDQNAAAEDDAANDTIRDELDRQEQRPRKVRAI